MTFKDYLHIIVPVTRLKAPEWCRALKICSVIFLMISLYSCVAYVIDNYGKQDIRVIMIVAPLLLLTAGSFSLIFYLLARYIEKKYVTEQ